MGDVKVPPQIYRGGIFGQGQPPGQKFQIFWTRPKIVARPLDLEKIIALAFLKATYSQIPY